MSQSGHHEGLGPTGDSKGQTPGSYSHGHHCSPPPPQRSRTDQISWGAEIWNKEQEIKTHKTSCLAIISEKYIDTTWG